LGRLVSGDILKEVSRVNECGIWNAEKIFFSPET
jgi:hypothetical protein